MRKWISMLVVLAFVASTAFASGNDLAYKRIQELETTTTIESGDYTVVYDASADSVKKVDANSPAAISGDVTFQTSLIASGRVNAASTVASSSTNLAPSSLPYVILLKSVGGNNSLDETAGGTRLPDGIPGQVLVLMIKALMTDGSWIVTPLTCTGFTAVTLDTKGDVVSLLYVDDTIGWIITSNSGASITQINYPN